MSQKRKANPALMGFTIGMHVALLLLIFLLPWLLQPDNQASGASGGEEGVEINLAEVKEVAPEPDPVPPEPEPEPTPPPPPPEPEPMPEPETKEEPEEKLTEEAEQADLLRKKEEEEKKKKEESARKKEKERERLKADKKRKEQEEIKKKQQEETKKKQQEEAKKKQEQLEKAKKEAAKKKEAEAQAAKEARDKKLKALGGGMGPGKGHADNGKPGFGDGNAKSNYDGDLAGILSQLWERQDVSSIEAKAGAKVHVLFRINRDGSLLVKTITASEDPAMKAAVENLLRQFNKAPPLPATFLGGTYTFETYFSKTDE
ncbi:MAG: hypothetical protein RL095_21 [Verrucomicrobiota bacterium]|jgi:colicin import membrane protein